MKIPMLPRLALICLLFAPSLAAAAIIKHERHRLGPWTLNISTDRFAGARTCALARHGVDYERKALVFHLPRRLDAASAVYRIDNGPPFKAVDDRLDLARQGFALQNDDLANPSGGLVRIPADRLATARAVRIETGPRLRIFTFRVDGLASALALARRAGCYRETTRPQP
jgi:hypothetical protein